MKALVEVVLEIVLEGDILFVIIHSKFHKNWFIPF